MEQSFIPGNQGPAVHADILKGHVFDLVILVKSIDCDGGDIHAIDPDVSQPDPTDVAWLVVLAPDIRFDIDLDALPGQLGLERGGRVVDPDPLKEHRPDRAAVAHMYAQGPVAGEEQGFL